MNQSCDSYYERNHSVYEQFYCALRSHEKGFVYTGLVPGMLVTVTGDNLYYSPEFCFLKSFAIPLPMSKL